jgi:hypothetical protein
MRAVTRTCRPRSAPASGGTRSDAWQWPTQFLVAAAGFGLICTAFVWASSKHYCRASVAMTLAAASFGAWAAFLAPLGNGIGI